VFLGNKSNHHNNKQSGVFIFNVKLRTKLLRADRRALPYQWPSAFFLSTHTHIQCCEEYFNKPEPECLRIAACMCAAPTNNTISKDSLGAKQNLMALANSHRASTDRLQRAAHLGEICILRGE
jgi:hypothetical protein